MATINQNVAGCNRRPGVQTQVRPLSVGISSNNSRDRSLHPAYGRIRCGFYRLITRSSIAVPCNYGSTDTRVRRSQTHTRERTYTEQNHRASLNVRLCTYLKPQPPCPPLSVKRTPFLAGGQRKTDRQTDRQRERERERERERYLRRTSTGGHYLEQTSLKTRRGLLESYRRFIYRYCCAPPFSPLLLDVHFHAQKSQARFLLLAHFGVRIR